MNISLIDEYVYLVLVDNGWTEKRDFLLADSWIEKIERKSNMQCFEYARKILHLFGGIKFNWVEGKAHNPIHSLDAKVNGI